MSGEKATGARGFGHMDTDVGDLKGLNCVGHIDAVVGHLKGLNCVGLMGGLKTGCVRCGGVDLMVVSGRHPAAHRHPAPMKVAIILTLMP